MSKQDRQGVRTPADVERKYNLGRLAAAQGSPGKQDEQIKQLSQTLAQFMAATNGKFQELEGHTQTFFYSGVPTLDNAPAVDWETNDVKAEHIGDLYYNEDDGSLYLFKGDGTDFEWVKCLGGEATLLDYTVTFIVDGETYEIVSVKKGNSVDAPSVEPTSEDGNFAGWYIGEGKVSFPYPPTADTEIIAKFSSLITMLYEHYAISEADYPYIFIFYNGSYIYPYFANTCTVSSGSISLSGVKDSAISAKLTDASDTTELVNAILEHTPSLSSATYNNTYKTNFTYYANFDLSSFGTYYPL